MKHQEFLVLEIGYDLDKYEIRLKEYEMWRWWVGEIIESILALMGHPCCQRGIGRIEPIGLFFWRILTWSENVRHRNSDTKIASITKKQYEELK